MFTWHTHRQPHLRLRGNRGIVVAAVCAKAVIRTAVGIASVGDDVDLRPDRVEELSLQQQRVLEHDQPLFWEGGKEYRVHNGVPARSTSLRFRQADQAFEAGKLLQQGASTGRQILGRSWSHVFGGRDILVRGAGQERQLMLLSVPQASNLPRSDMCTWSSPLGKTWRRC